MHSYIAVNTTKDKWEEQAKALHVLGWKIVSTGYGVIVFSAK